MTMTINGMTVTGTVEEIREMIANPPKMDRASAGEKTDRECVPCGENACELMTLAHAALAKASGEREEEV